MPETPINYMSISQRKNFIVGRIDFKCNRAKEQLLWRNAVSPLTEAPESPSLKVAPVKIQVFGATISFISAAQTPRLEEAESCQRRFDRRVSLPVAAAWVQQHGLERGWQSLGDKAALEASVRPCWMERRSELCAGEGKLGRDEK